MVVRRGAKLVIYPQVSIGAIIQLEEEAPRRAKASAA
jgi:hypothetical protein